MNFTLILLSRQAVHAVVMCFRGICYWSASGGRLLQFWVVFLSEDAAVDKKDVNHRTGDC